MGILPDPLNQSIITKIKTLINNVTYTIDEYTSSSGNFTVPVGVHQLDLIIVGAGGGGASAGQTGGGGAGEVLFVKNHPVKSGEVIPYVVGSGGAAGADGGNTYFGYTWASAGKGGGASGGAGGGNSNSTAGGGLTAGTSFFMSDLTAYTSNILSYSGPGGGSGAKGGDSAWFLGGSLTGSDGGGGGGFAGNAGDGGQAAPSDSYGAGGGSDTAGTGGAGANGYIMVAYKKA
jgi:hypothetical protein